MGWETQPNRGESGPQYSRIPGFKGEMSETPRMNAVDDPGTYKNMFRISPLEFFVWGIACFSIAIPHHLSNNSSMDLDPDELGFSSTFRLTPGYVDPNFPGISRGSLGKVSTNHTSIFVAYQ